MKQLWLAAVALLCAEISGAQEAKPATVVDLGLAPVRRVAPQYPVIAERNRVQGYVDLKIVVNHDGTVKSVTPIRAEPKLTFEAAAVRAAEQWLFEPRAADSPVAEAWQRLEFKLPGEPDACVAARLPARPEARIDDALQRRLGEIHKTIKAGDYVSAQKALESLVAQTENQFGKAVVLHTLGYVHASTSRHDSAIASYEQALAIGTLPWRTHDSLTLNVARLHAAAGRRGQAFEVLQRYFKEACQPELIAHLLRDKLTAAETTPTDPPR